MEKKHGLIDYHLTQVFGTHWQGDDECAMFTGSRFKLELSFGIPIDGDSLENIMLERKKEWKLVHDFVRHIVSWKEK